MESATPHAQERPLSERLRGSAAALAYLALSLPIGVACVALLLVAGLVGVVLSPLWVGFAILGWTAVAAWHYARLERLVANRLLGARIPPLPPRRRIDASGWRRIGASFRETGSRRS